MRACSSTALPLLAATAIAILTFLPIYYSPHITGELLSSLVIVIGVSLMFSWVFALTQTPFFIQEFVRRPRPDELTGELFSGKYYDYFRSSLRLVIKYRYATVGILSVLLVISAWGFQFIPKVFVPSLDKQYFTLDMCYRKVQPSRKPIDTLPIWSNPSKNIRRRKWFRLISDGHRPVIIYRTLASVPNQTMPNYW